MERREELPTDLETEATRGRRLLVISCDEDGTLAMEENTFAGWAMSGVARWLELVAEATMCEEMTEPEDDE